MKVPDKLLLAAMGIAVAAAAITIVLAWEVPDANAQEAKTPVAGQASLTVTVASLQPATFPIRVSANGNINGVGEQSAARSGRRVFCNRCAGANAQCDLQIGIRTG